VNAARDGRRRCTTYKIDPSLQMLLARRDADVATGASRW
jgi:hypothetical protein